MKITRLLVGQELTKVQDHLSVISKLFTAENEFMKARAFSKAVSSLSQTTAIIDHNGVILNKIPGIGEAIATVIEQFLATGTSSKYLKLYKKHPTISAAKTKAIVFPREMVIAGVAKALSPLTRRNIDWGFAGSLRRGAENVHDVDVVVCGDKGIRDKVVNILQAEGLYPDVRDGSEKVGITLTMPGVDKSIVLDMNFTTPDRREPCTCISQDLQISTFS